MVTAIKVSVVTLLVVVVGAFSGRQLLAVHSRARSPAPRRRGSDPFSLLTGARQPHEWYGVLAGASIVTFPG